MKMARMKAAVGLCIAMLAVPGSAQPVKGKKGKKGKVEVVFSGTKKLAEGVIVGIGKAGKAADEALLKGFSVDALLLGDWQEAKFNEVATDSKSGVSEAAEKQKWTDYAEDIECGGLPGLEARWKGGWDGIKDAHVTVKDFKRAAELLGEYDYAYRALEASKLVNEAGESAAMAGAGIVALTLSVEVIGGAIVGTADSTPDDGKIRYPGAQHSRAGMKAMPRAILTVTSNGRLRVECVKEKTDKKGN
ncbi:MAG: hypothetical protein AAB320_02475 [Elusimicrobiota bacterium]